MARQYTTIQTDNQPLANDPKALVSVILPIYNAEPYLDQALDSVQNQTHKNLEIICINDGSTDNSLEITKAHAAQDERIIIIDKDNEGYGAGCNRGLDEAHGEWIAIVEPDDWIEPDMYADMLLFAAMFNKLIDIVKTPYWRIVFPDTPQQQKVNCPFKYRVSQSKRPFTIGENSELLRHHPCIWSALYRRDFLVGNKIRFKPIPGAGWADNPFLIETMCQAKRIVYLDKAYYCYREDTQEKTAMFHINNWHIPIDRWNDMQDVIERLDVSDKRVLGAHTKRGLMYAGGVLESNNADEHPEILEKIKRMFARMDPELVWAEPDTEPGFKRLFAELRGIPMPEIDLLGYRLHVLGLGFYALRNMGVKQSALAVNHYLTTKKKRSAGR